MHAYTHEIYISTLDSQDKRAFKETISISVSEIWNSISIAKPLREMVQKSLLIESSSRVVLSLTFEEYSNPDCKLELSSSIKKENSQK